MSVEKADIIARVCDALNRANLAEAKETLQAEYPFSPVTTDERDLTELEKLRVFRRDGFVDRYSGQRLVFPGTLRLLSILLPDEFPYDSGWKMDKCHIAYWQLFPTIDHIVPVARGGGDVLENLVTTSMPRNSAKANSTLEELGWSLVSPGKREDWDGLLRWFLEYTAAHSSLLDHPYLRTWHRAARKLMSEEGRTVR